MTTATHTPFRFDPNAVRAAARLTVRSALIGKGATSAFWDLFVSTMRAGGAWEEASKAFNDAVTDEIRLMKAQAEEGGITFDLTVKEAKASIYVYQSECNACIRFIDAGFTAPGTILDGISQVKQFNKACREAGKAKPEKDTPADDVPPMDQAVVANRIAQFAASIQSVIQSGMNDAERQTARDLMAALSVAVAQQKKVA